MPKYIPFFDSFENWKIIQKPELINYLRENMNITVDKTEVTLFLEDEKIISVSIDGIKEALKDRDV